MKFVILDVYPQKNYRLIKDTAGGYGTGNNFGNTLFSKLLNRYVDQSIGMPAMEVMYISSILKKNNEVHYTREIDDPKINMADFVILPSSIIAHETEINTLKKINHKQVFVTGIFSNTLREKYESENSVIVKNEADTFFYNLQKSGKLNKEFSPLKPDSKHLHQLAFLFLIKKFNFKLISANNISSLIIFFFNFVIIYISALNPSNTIFQIKLIITSMIFYNVSYIILFRFFNSNFKSKE